MLLCHRHHDSGTRKIIPRATVKVASKKNERLERSRVLGFAPAAARRLPSPSAWHMDGMARLLLRLSPLKRRFTVVDTASMPTLTPLRDSIRARDENCLLTVGAPDKLHGRR